ncbi:MAG TPA: lamin tail domain-containing protein [Candidatus Nanoarchaeia archaeon]|nr:lamin tail domain-containing protein [Candidatus Nanoarchaeia archaeon]
MRVHMGWKKFIAFCILLLIALLPACSKTSNNDSSEITGKVAAKIYRACAYPDGKFCDSNCCVSSENCNGNDAYNECDLETGKWKTESYSDAACSKKCVPIESNPKTQLKGCNEGWECIDEKYRGYKTADCKWDAIEKCPQSCANGECKTYACTPPAMKCFGNELKVCSLDGSSWGLVEKCENSCTNGECTDGTAQNQNSQETGSNLCNDCIKFNVEDSNIVGSISCTNSLFDEYIVLKNECDSSCSLEGWSISDDTSIASHVYTFPSFSVNAKSSFKLYTGKGTNSAASMYWGKCSSIWNNDGDTVTIKNSNGEVVLTNTY